MKKEFEIEIGVTTYTITENDLGSYDFKVFNGSAWQGLTDNLTREDLVRLRDFINKTIK